MGEIVKTKELARRLDVKPATVRRWAQAGLIPVMRVSAKVIRFDVAEVMRALRERATKTQRGTAGGAP